MRKNYFLAILAVFMVFGLGAQVIWSDDFEDQDISDWTSIDADGDGRPWLISTADGVNGGVCIVSESWNSGTGPLTPDNYLVSPAIDLTSATGTLTLSWFAKAQDPSWTLERYQVIVAQGNTQAELDAGDVVFEEVIGMTDNQYVQRSVNLSAYAGDSVHVAFRHYNSTDQFWINIDEIALEVVSNTEIELLSIFAPSNQVNGCSFGTEETVTLQVKNSGGTPLSEFEISYSINGGTPVTEVVSQVVEPAEVALIDFATKADFSQIGRYEVEASVTVEGDEVAENNSASSKFTHGDALIEVVVATQVSGGHSWSITDKATGEVVYSRGGYQWNTINRDTVCVLDANCYSFQWNADAVVNGEYLALYYNGALSGGSTVPTGIPVDLTFGSIGGGAGCPTFDAGMESLESGLYAILDDDLDIAVNVLNSGVLPINTLTLGYSINGAEPIEETYNTVISPNTVQRFTLSPSPVVESSEDQSIRVEVLSINGEPDTITANNVIEAVVQVLDYKPEQGVLVEEATGTWCQFCPRGHVFMEAVEETYPEADLVAVHQGDPMENGVYIAEFGQLIGGYPSGIIDRIPVDVDPSEFPEAVEERKDRLTPVDIQISAFYDGGDQLDAEVSANFLAGLQGEHRILLLLVESGVTGTSPGYAQVNAYAGGGIGPMGGYENLPNPVPASDMVYNNVLLYSPSGFYGQEGSIPDTDIARNSEYTYNWTVDIPAGSNPENLYLVAAVLEAETGLSVNSDHLLFRDFTSSVPELSPEEASLNIFPNPFDDVLNIRVNMKESTDAELVITDMLGNNIAQRSYQNLVGDQVIQYPTSQLSQGMYLINLYTPKGQLTKKAVLAR